jgi:uncharacterized protein (DUF58 family)
MAIFLIVLVTLGGLLELLSLKDSLTKIRYQSTPSKSGCEPGETFLITTTVMNYSHRTIPFMRLEEIFPSGIQLPGKEAVPAGVLNYIHTSLLYIRGRQKITRTVQASLPERGSYQLEGCRLYCGDFLGIREKCKEIGQREELVIFPKLLQEASILNTLSGYYGDFSARRYFTEDPVLVSSYREYTGREPMRSISWMQSARRNELMVKEFDHTMDLSVTILLDVYLHWSEGSHTEHLEYCYSLVRTIAEFLEQKKVSYRLLTNAYISNGATVHDILSKAGQGPHHFSSLLFTLGRAIPDTFHGMEDLYDMTVKSYSGENAVFYVAPFENEKRSSLVKSLRDRLSCRIYPFYASERMEAEQDVSQSI